MKKLLGVVSVFLFFVFGVSAQPFIEEIRDFKKQDSISFPAKNVNLFVGSSSLRMWKNIKEDFSGYKVINRGFGGSSLPDVIRYANDIIFPYQPKQVIIYCGENDLAGSDTVSAATVADRFKILFGMIRNRWRNMPVAFISIKPSPSRQQLMVKMVAANKLIKQFLSTQPKTKYIDVYSLMLMNGKPNKKLFLEDMLHMNALGYAIWKKAIRPVLMK